MSENQKNYIESFPYSENSSERSEVEFENQYEPSEYNGKPSIEISRTPQEITPSKRIFRIVLLVTLGTLVLVGLIEDIRIFYLTLLISGFLLVLSIVVGIFVRIFRPGGRHLSFWDIIFLDDFIQLLFFLGKLIVVLAFEIFKES